MFLLLTLAACGDSPGAADAGAVDMAPFRETRAPCAERDPLRRAFFGDLHVHTALSFDAWTYDVRTTPADAYRFARGETIRLPPLDSQGRPTADIRLDRPLDFAAVTDHAEYLGEVSLCTTPGSPAYDSLTCQKYRGPNRSFFDFGIGGFDPIRAQMCGAGGALCTDAAAPIWRGVQDAAEAAYDRTSACRFTSFVGYEYTLSPLGTNLHRNVIFRSDHVTPRPITWYEAPTPLELWSQLDAACLRAGAGCDVLAIPHNPNISNGRMFVPEYPDAASADDERRQAALRARMEPLLEIMQHKGDSECINGLASVPGAPDELCDFEKVQAQPLKDCGPRGVSYGGFTGGGCTSWTDFARGALEMGLLEQVRLGVNPYRLGFVGGTDTHSGTAGAVDEKGFRGHLGITDADAKGQLSGLTLAGRPLVSNPGGLTGVWAEENTRDAIFDALGRRETFATSGPRIVVRLFGGWALDKGLCTDPALVEKGYAGGVPMGGLLGPRPSGAGAPRFIVAAARDPGTSDHPSAPLQRIEIIKGWVDAAGQPRERVHLVAGDPKNGASVDLATCAPQGPGAATLCATWEDPDFDPARPAFYYARVVENPTCRWSRWACIALPPDEQTALGCDQLGVPDTIQERAWTSPIWY